MSKGRLIGLASALVAVIALTAFSYLRFGQSPSAPGGSTAVPGDAGNAPSASMLTSGELIAFWGGRIERDPRDYISLTELAAAHIRRVRETGDVESYTRAEAALERALGLNPRYAGALAYRASLLFARHDFQGALEIAERIYSQDQSAAHALGIVGDANLELGRYAEAESAYTTLLGLSDSAPVLSRLAHLRELQGRPAEAIELASRAAALADQEEATPESRAWYHSQFARLYFNTGDLAAAEEQYDASLRAFPGYVHAHAGLGRVSAARGEYGEAIDLYEEVVARQPVLEYVAALGDVYHAAGREDEAQRQFGLVEAIERIYRANGINTDLETALFIADHPSADGSVEEAVAQARAVHATQPGSIRANDVLSWALYQSGHFEEALVYSRQAVRLGTQDPLLLFHAGMINYRLGNDDEARGYLERALDANPRFSLLHAEAATDALAELKASVQR